MQEIPIAIEATGSKSFIEVCATEETLVQSVIDSLNENMSVLTRDISTPIAIVGMGFRGPGEAADVNKLWRMILEQREGWKAIPTQRWNNNAFYHPDHTRHGSINVEGGHFLEEDISRFDAPFFNMTSDEAAAMDPQQRLLLEVTYEALENAGITLPQFMGSKTSCFAGSFSADYTDMLLRDPECVPMYQCTNAGQSRAMVANRVSYFYDLKGPSVTVDTACSGSLVALHLACQSLQSGNASMAVAAGVNLVLSHEFMSTMSMMRFLSPGGRCYTFDEKANGYARGEAIGCLIIKPLANALRDQNTIRAIIRATGSNQDGRTPGITLPSGPGQEALIRDVYTRAGLDPNETEVIEAHGTGTQAGDPIETGAISRVFGVGRSPDNPVRIGSIKTNVGHLEGASGIAGVIKAVLMLENCTILPSRNFHTPNPRIRFDEWNLKVQLTAEPWETAGPHRVSVNSFGYGGSNAHVILEDASGYLSARGILALLQLPSKLHQAWDLQLGNHAQETPERHRIFMISGFDEASCAAQMKALGGYLHEVQGVADEQLMDDLAFTLNEHRTRFMWKAAVVGKSTSDLAASLSSGFKIRSSIRKPTLGFVFTGQGAQWVGMGRELLHAYPVFQESIVRIDEFLATLQAPFSVYDRLSKDAEHSQLSHPLLSQTICTALQIALVDLLAFWGIYPDAVTGHSSGEIAAAYASCALTVEDAIAVAYNRGLAASQLLNSQVKGSMMAIGISPEETQPYLEGLTSGDAVIACVNSPSSVTVSGDAAAIDELAGKLKDKAVFSRRLAVDVAYHSHHMELVAHRYLVATEYIQPLDLQPMSKSETRVSFFSSVTGRELQPDELDPQYWVSNMLGQVKFSESLKALCFETSPRNSATGLPTGGRARRTGAAQKPSVDCLLEIGPHSALAGPIKQILEDNVKLKAAETVYASVLSRQSHAVTSALQAVSTLASMNYPVNFEAINFPRKTPNKRAPRLLVDLPTYSWNHTRSYWAEPRLSKMFRNREHPRTDLLGAPDNMRCPFEPRWRNYLRVSEIPWLADHKIQSDIVFPAAGYLSIAIEAAMQLAKGGQDIAGFVLQDVRIQSALIIPETAGIEILTSLRKSDQTQTYPCNDGYIFHIYSVSGDDKWTEHCTGVVGIESNLNEQNKIPTCDMNGFIIGPPGPESHSISDVNVDQLYKELSRVGLEYGPCFANLSSAHATRNGTCVAELSIPDTAAIMPMNFQHPLLIHPCTLDSTFHTIFAGLPDGISLEEGPLLPVSIESVRVSCQIKSSAGEVLGTCTHVRPTAAGGVVASITATDSDSWKPKLSISGLRCTRLETAPSDARKQKDIPIAYGIEWKPDPDLLFERNDLLSRYLSQQDDQIDSVRYELDQSTATLISEYIVKSDGQVRERSDSIGKYRAFLTELIQMRNSDQSLTNTNGAIETGSTDLSAPRTTLLRALEDHLSALGKNDETIKTTRDNLWDAYWDVLSTEHAYQAAVQYLELTGHKRPDISVLEVASGAGKPCTMFLEALTGGKSTPRCAKYTFAYQEESEIEMAKQQLVSWSDVVDFTKLDFDAEKTGTDSSKPCYDLIILPLGPCQLQSIRRALANIKSLLKLFGYFIMIDLDPRRSLLDAVILSAQYLWPAGIFDVSRATLPEICEMEHMLQEAGFTIRRIGSQSLRANDRDALFICRPNEAQGFDEKEFFIIEDSTHDAITTKCLSSRLLELSCAVTITEICYAQPDGKICIVFCDMQKHPFASLDSQTLEKLKGMFLHSAGVLWITRGGVLEPSSPEAGLVFGFARTARSESSVKPIITLDLDALHPLSSFETTDLIVDIIRARFLQTGLNDEDAEYAERGGILHIPRVVERPDLNQDIVRGNKPVIDSEQLFRLQSQPLRLTRANTRYPRPHLTTDTQMTELAMGYVGIKVLAFGLNEWDISNDTVKIGIDDTPGLECSGRVYAVGPGVHDFAVGDRVACLGTGAARAFYHDHESAFQKIGDAMPYELAAAIPVAYSTAYYVAHYLARIAPHDTVLIHNAGSRLGEAMVELCMLSKAAALAIVATSAQRELLLNRFQILVSQKGTVDSVLSLTNGKKADVVIFVDDDDSQDMQFLWQCIAPFGRFIRLQTREADANNRYTIARPSKNISVTTLSILDFQREKADLARQAFCQVTKLFHGKLRGPSQPAVYDVGAIEETLRVLPSEKHVVVTAGDNARVKAVLPNDTKPLFQGTASYLLIGGVGGIGRAIALWMADHGAKHLILVNRSGLSAGSGRSTVEELHAKGVRVTVQACDISDEVSVSKMISDVHQNSPPLRGVIHGAMVLKDVHIEKMTIDDYHTVLRPRYNGTWNLHKHLPANLDFFVMLSSISGVIGNATQAAYAAGSAFMDAFAAYRNAMGLPAVSLDLGTITDVGYLASNKELLARMETQGFQGTNTQTLLSLVRVAIKQPPTADRAQIVTGLGEWKDGESLGNFDDPLFSHFRRRFQSQERGSQSGDTVAVLHEALRASKTPDDAITVVFEALRIKIAEQFAVSVDRVEPSSPLSDFGLDSHVAVDLRNWISKVMDSSVSILDILTSTSVLQLAGQIAGRSRLVDVKDGQ